VSAGLLERPVVDRLRFEEPESVAHIVAPKDGKTGQALVMEARIFGFAIEALCGHRLIPQRDATALPLCQACKALIDEAFYDGASDEANQ
jgi:hypothetical protein